MKNYVVLVTESNVELGTLDKFEAHNRNTPLHRGLSVFLFNESRELLLQQRSSKKKTWPETWSNSCCGHPKLNESPIDAAKRHLKHELGIQAPEITMILPKYRYRFEQDGIVENEICPVMVAYTKEKPILNPDEVKEIRWIPWGKWLREIEVRPDSYSPWCVEETLLLKTSREFRSYFRTTLPKLSRME